MRTLYTFFRSSTSYRVRNKLAAANNNIDPASNQNVERINF